MSDELNKLILESTPDQESTNELLGKLFEVTKPTAIYSEPVTAGDHTVITASEVTAVFGAGFGYGLGIVPEGGESEDTGPAGGSSGSGGGGGGGGTTLARPVAAIAIGPDGVRVEPIVDPTKIVIAFFTTIGAIFMALGKMRRFRQTGRLE